MTITDGKHTFRFDRTGFPEFNIKFETLLDNIHIGGGSRREHIRAANQKLYHAVRQSPQLAQELGLAKAEVDRLPAMSKAPEGYIWHHHQDVGRMQLVREEEHILATPHTGGMAIWGGGSHR